MVKKIPTVGYMAKQNKKRKAFSAFSGCITHNTVEKRMQEWASCHTFHSKVGISQGILGQFL